MTEAIFGQAIGELRAARAPARRQQGSQKMVSAQPEVLARFQSGSSPAQLPARTRAEFSEFLIFRNNQHWSGLNRKVSMMRWIVG